MVIVVAGGWVTVKLVVVIVTGGIGVVEEVTTGAAAVVKKLTVQALFEVPVTVLTLHQYTVLYFKVSLKGVALVGQVAL